MHPELEARLARLQHAIEDAAGSDAGALIGAAAEFFTDDPVCYRPQLAGIETAEHLERLRLDPQAIAAALVHELHRQEQLDVERATERLGEEIMSLSAGVLRLDRIRWDRLEEEAAESLRKMFLAMASDLRVVLIALAARVHTMRTLDECDPEQQHRLASETMEVYAPLANRLGIWQLKWELEDLAFRSLDPTTYREIKRLLAEKRAARTDKVDDVMQTLRDALAEAGVEARVTGRPKHIYSIWKKMQRKRISFEQIYDVSATRIIVDRIDQCYAVLGLVHGLWTPIDGEFDDYIAKPKENFYRSLHTAVIGPSGRPLEIQIRTQEMHDYNEYGVAAHWRYKEAKRADRRFDEKINWVRQLIEWQKDVTDPHDLAQSLKTDIFTDQVYVFTPSGDVVDLPVGATPIDFAYRIHTQVGHHCRGARVNGQIVPLDYELQIGDRIEILTAKSGGPSRDWLNPHLGQVRTAGAKQKIRQYFRQQERGQSIQQGKETVERELKRLGLEAKRVDDLLPLYPRFANLDDLYAAIGFGEISGHAVASKLLELEHAAAAAAPIALEPPPATKPKAASSVSVAGVDDVLSQPARCCRPVPGDQVVGYITRGRGVVIHRVDCPNYLNHDEPDRWMELTWGEGGAQSYPVAIEVVAYDRHGLLRDIVELVALEGVNLTGTSARHADKGEKAIIDLTLQIRNNGQVIRILNRIERLRDVLSARRRVG